MARTELAARAIHVLMQVFILDWGLIFLYTTILFLCFQHYSYRTMVPQTLAKDVWKYSLICKKKEGGMMSEKQR